MATWCGGVVVSVAVAGCTLPNPQGAQAPMRVDGLAYVLASQTNVYFVREPLRLSLHVKNVSDRKQTLPAVLDAGYELRIRGPGGNAGNRAVWEVHMPAEDRDLQSGESRFIALPRSVNDSCVAPGPHQVRYCYFGQRRGTEQEPLWSTPAITIMCAEQPLVIPKGTDIRVTQALSKLQNSPVSAIFSARPGWAAVEYSEPMTQLATLGKVAVPALLANLRNSALELPIIQLLGDMKVKQAVPCLLDCLWMQDDPHDSLIIAKLADITDHPDGYGFHRRWFDKETQEAAVGAYRDWWAHHGSGHANAANEIKAEPPAGGDGKPAPQP